MLRSVHTRILTVVGLLLIACVMVLLSPRSPHAEPARITIPAGTNASSIGHILQEAEIIRWGPAFRWYATLTGKAKKLQAGDYLLCPCSDIPELAQTIANGEALSTDIPVTIPEGMNVWEIADVLQKAELLNDPAAFARTYLEKEGMLFPETYRFAPDSTPAQLAKRMLDTFTERANGVTQGQLIIASVLEKEAKTRDDMALISGIIQNRLALGMPLQVDATVAYGACHAKFLVQSSNALCDVTQIGIAKEITIDSPYNTYVRKGLPAGPISNPGENALWAAEHPQASNYLYYLSTRDGERIIYATTLEEHLQNRSKYLGL